MNFTIKGWHVAAGVTAFFAMIIAVDAAFLTLAYRTHPGQVASKPYEAGLLYNAELKRQRRQAELGWRAAAEARPQGLAVWLRDRDGQPLTGLTVSADLQRPATEQGRTRLDLSEAEPGLYVAQRAGLSGTWDAAVAARDAAGRDFTASRRLTWP
ncbi:MAG: FixH family protein [Brevundimonas sp.]|uniref:FixH family protein n=1 Tax=Brevundimonas sp. TaxID=1871086 RepID=UPI00180FD2F8|nr:FixH family protein [Brevundimonas sp.]MBA4805713.1 FixH family protein [Brevundimonas sp.]